MYRIPSGNQQPPVNQNSQQNLNIPQSGSNFLTIYRIPDNRVFLQPAPLLFHHGLNRSNASSSHGSSSQHSLSSSNAGSPVHRTMLLPRRLPTNTVMHTPQNGSPNSSQLNTPNIVPQRLYLASLISQQGTPVGTVTPTGTGTPNTGTGSPALGASSSHGAFRPNPGQRYSNPR